MYAYIVVSLLTGLRTEEARALAWDLVDLEQGTVAVWPSERVGRDTKAAKSRRTLMLGEIVTEALRAWQEDQEQERTAANGWVEHGLVFTTGTGRGLSAGTVRR